MRNVCERERVRQTETSQGTRNCKRERNVQGWWWLWSSVGFGERSEKGAIESEKEPW